MAAECRRLNVGGEAWLTGGGSALRMFSRLAGQVIAQYGNFVRLGREGYRRVQQAAYDVAAYVAALC